ncbi:unnamed protein product [Ectocarpus sp. 6 AP-2014]
MEVPELPLHLPESGRPHRPSQEATAAVVYRREVEWTRRWLVPPCLMKHQNPQSITSTSPADDALLAPALLPSPLWSSLTRGRFDDGWACGFRESILANPSA